VSDEAGKTGAAWGRSLASRLAVAGVSITLTLLVAEGALRILRPTGGGALDAIGTAWPEGTRPPSSQFVLDPELGYRPRLGTDLYNELGTRVNAYPAARGPGVARVLLLGDSVTFRGALAVGLRRGCRGVAVEFWNAGVEGYNTVQEVRYHLRYSRAVQADHVVLTFHNNDFVSTPVVMAGEGDELLVIQPDRRIEGQGTEPRDGRDRLGAGVPRIFDRLCRRRSGRQSRWERRLAGYAR